MSEQQAPGGSKKGLRAGSIGLIGAIAIGISCIAPDYTLTASIGAAVSAVGEFTPGIVLLGLLPMLFVALGYKEMNRAIPDSGSSFTWVTRAFGPVVGWLTGWGLVVSTIIVLAMLAQMASEFFWQLLGQIFSNDTLFNMASNKLVDIITVTLFLVGATYVSYRDIRITQRFQFILVSFQLLAVFIFGLVALIKVGGGGVADALTPSWAWFNPFGSGSFSGIVEGLTIAVFIFWGWDVCLTMTEETKDPAHTPGRAAAWTVVTITVYYLFVSVATIAFAGLGDTGTGLNNPDIQDNVFKALSGPVLGPFAFLISLAVLSSSIASLESTFISPARTMLAMGHYSAVNKRFASLTKYATPKLATLAAGGVAIVFYIVMRLVSDSVLQDTLLTLSALICFYYGFTAFGAVWYFRKQWFASMRNFWFQLVFPLVGGIFLAILFVKTIIDSFLPEYGSGTAWFGVGAVFILTIVILLIGVILMIVQISTRPTFFKGGIIPRGHAQGNGLDPDFTALTDSDIEAGLVGVSEAEKPGI